MEFFILCNAILVLVLFLFGCSVTSFLNQLPNCGNATKKAIDRSLVRMGYFINFKRNANILSNIMKELDTRIQELEESQSDKFHLKCMLSIREKAVEASDEVGRIINTPWHKRWSRSYCQLTIRVASIISEIQWELNRDTVISEPKDDRIPGIVVVFLIAYALTNAVLYLPYFKTTKADVIDWIVIEMAHPFKLKNYLPRLKKEVIEISRRHITLLEEAKLVCDEAEYMVNYWYKGWTGSRYRISKRAYEIIKILRQRHLKGGGTNSRKIIFSIDKMSQILPEAITDIRHYLHVNTNIELLKQLIHDSARGRLSAAEAQKLEKDVKLLEAAQDEAMQLIQKAQSCLDKHWYQMWPASRYRLHRKLAKKTIHMSSLEKDLNRKLDKLRRHARDIRLGGKGDLTLARSS